MGTAITVRDMPEDARDELAARAARSGRTLQEYLRALLIDMAATPDVEEILDRVRERKLATGTRLTARKLRAYRDRERR